MRSILEDDRLNAEGSGGDLESHPQVALRRRSREEGIPRQVPASRSLRTVQRQVWKNSSQFEALTPGEMRSILEDDPLNAQSEVEETLKTILKWVSADAAARKGNFAKFLPLVPFVRCSVT
ncbi:hypothetical protein MTO96_037234 [Rhipicephalus appendiculatus]